VKKLGEGLALLTSSSAVTLAWAAVFQTMWAWFVVKEFGAPAATLRQALVVAIFRAFLLHRKVDKDETENETDPPDLSQATEWRARMRPHWQDVWSSLVDVIASLVVASIWHWVFLR
jgi:hypothetical protein